MYPSLTTTRINLPNSRSCKIFSTGVGLVERWDLGKWIELGEGSNSCLLRKWPNDEILLRDVAILMALRSSLLEPEVFHLVWDHSQGTKDTPDLQTNTRSSSLRPALGVTVLYRLLFALRWKFNLAAKLAREALFSPGFHGWWNCELLGFCRQIERQSLLASSAPL